MKCHTGHIFSWFHRHNTLTNCVTIFPCSKRKVETQLKTKYEMNSLPILAAIKLEECPPHLIFDKVVAEFHFTN